MDTDNLVKGAFYAIATQWGRTRETLKKKVA
jgi:hypothetical protein